MYRLLLLFFCISCRHEDIPPIYTTVEIAGRHFDQPLYRAKMPPGWSYQRPDSLTDTTNAIAEFYLHDPAGSIRLTFHNFPTDRPQQQVPPMAQIQRWKQQFDPLDPAAQVVKPQSFSGYVGYLFEGTGSLRGESKGGESKTVFGWAMQLAPEHAQHLQAPSSRSEALYFKEMGAAITLKAVGPSTLMIRQKKSLIAFARSFELITELPAEL